MALLGGEVASLRFEAQPTAAVPDAFVDVTAGFAAADDAEALAGGLTEKKIAKALQKAGVGMAVSMLDRHLD